MEESATNCLAVLVLSDSTGQSRHIEITRQTTVIGRRHPSDIVLSSPLASKCHAAIEQSGIQWILRDLKSLNGVRVNGVRITTDVVLSHGDRIELADVQAIFLLPVQMDDDQTIYDGRASNDASPRVVLDRAARELTVDGAPAQVVLTRNEYLLLELLDRQRGSVFTHAALGAGIWGDGAFDKNMLHTLVFRLRAKLKELPVEVVGVAGVGFKLVSRSDK